MMKNFNELEVILDADEEFDTEWYKEHDYNYTDNHFTEYKERKKQFIKDYLHEAEIEYFRAMEYQMEYQADDYFSRGDVQYGWYQQDMIDLRRIER